MGPVSYVNDKEDSEEFGALSNKAVKIEEYAHQSIPYSSSSGEVRGNTRLQHLCPNDDHKASRVVQYSESSRRRIFEFSVRRHTPLYAIRHSGIRCVVQQGTIQRIRLTLIRGRLLRFYAQREMLVHVLMPYHERLSSRGRTPLIRQLRVCTLKRDVLATPSFRRTSTLHLQMSWWG
jgi:hypothetical protein